MERDFKLIVEEWKRALEMDEPGAHKNQDEMRQDLVIIRLQDARFARLGEKLLDAADELTLYIKSREQT